MAWQKFPCLGFQSDLPLASAGYFLYTDLCVPTDRGIGPSPIITETTSGAIDGVCLGSALVTQLDDTQYCVIGTADKLYSTEGIPANLTDRSAFAYSASTSKTWDIAQFGNITLAANRGDFLQFSTLPANFASVGAAPVPKASIVITAGPTSAPFVVVADYDDGTNNDKDGWKCSALGDYTNWTASTATQSATGRLLDGVPGKITAMVPYRDGIVAFKRTGMYIGSYTGPPNIWSWQKISSDVGCIGKNAVVEANDVIYFADEAGIWSFDGSYPRQIGPINNWWVNILSTNGTGVNRDTVKVVWDKTRHLIWFLTKARVSVGDATLVVKGGLAFNLISRLWTGFGASRLPFSASGGTVMPQEIIASAAVVSYPNLKVGTLGTSSSSEIAQLYSWLFSDAINNPIIKGVRPAWSVAPLSAIGSWVSGQIYTGFSDAVFLPANIGSLTNLATLTYRDPGKLDGVASAERLGFNLLTTTSSGFWEMTDISVDVGTQGTS